MNKWLPSFVSLLCGLAFLLAAVSPSTPNVSAQDTDTGQTDMARQEEERFQKKNRLREGAEIVDQIGSFEWIGDRLSFSPEEGDHVFKILENRMMERVVQTQETSTGKLVWVVTGTITEYRGSNYLLMKHVILDGKRND
ncbi:hypothetical protein DTL21_25275 [Bremerella cremea]|uniref:Uncharacterized protein n=1 Tax=Blastopirellula marina TaxID=124 RepID=A0A2S8FB80_9BACT|nr:MULTISPECIES: hypothetical protein [Pirellulaceae]PQO29380.1 hypothetical protein C5Y83_25230 [Blastopirellula marina]RCS42684.1 hypothetical protein DTL21_25275 [Bremerella cremea]